MKLSKNKKMVTLRKEQRGRKGLREEGGKQ